MATNGIGASVRRKEDHRFITGRGTYTDDIDRPGQAYAYFVRSPHAHARIKGIDKSQALAAPGVLAVLDGGDVKAAGWGGLICGWMVKSKDGSDMKVGPHPILAQDKARYVGDHVACVVAETYHQASDAAELLEVDYEELPACVVDRPCPRPGSGPGPRRHRAQHRVRVGARRPGGGGSGVRERGPRHQDRPGQQPARAECDRAARRDRRVRPRHRRFHPVYDQPEPARRAPDHLGLHRRRAGAQAARDRARRGRRLRLQDLRLRRGVRLPARREEDSAGR